MAWIRLAQADFNEDGPGGVPLLSDVSIRLDDVRRIIHNYEGGGINVVLADGRMFVVKGDDATRLLAALNTPPDPP